MMYSNHHMSTGGWIFSILGMIILLALALGTVVWIVSEMTNRRRMGSASVAAGETLDRRLASGELTVEQYEQVRHTLGQTSPRPPESKPSHPAAAAS
jgi:uncharacterized membrane protein